MVKNCMRDIRPVLETEERQKATQQIESAAGCSQVDDETEAFSTAQLESGQHEPSIVAAATTGEAPVDIEATTTTLEPTSPENLEPSEGDLMQLPIAAAHAEPEVTDTSLLVSVGSFYNSKHGASLAAANHCCLL